MIEWVPPTAGASQGQLLLRPRRALTARQFRGVFAVLAGSIWLVALAASAQGNVFAPAFALLDTALVALGLRWAWREGERFELIAVHERELWVRRSNQAQPAFRAHPGWVRLRLARQDGQARVLLGSRGQQVEVGGFLSADERLDLADRLQQLLARASGLRRDIEQPLEAAR